MCSKCDRHELWGGLCLDHLKEEKGIESFDAKIVEALKITSPSKTMAKIDAIELNTADAPVTEERTDDEEE